MNLLINLDSWVKVFIVCVVAGAALTVAFAVLLMRQTKKNNSANGERNIHAKELLLIPDSETANPIVPKCFTSLGMWGGLFAFGICGILFHDASGRGLPVPAVIAICFCMALAAQVGLSMSVYAYKLKKDESIIFVPKAIGLTGKVYKDIPAGRKGFGAIRLFMNNQVVTMSAISVDEVVLARGADIRIIYADSDRVAVVERWVQSPIE